MRDAVVDAVQGDTGSVREDLRGDGAEGALLVVALAVVHVVVWYPAEILDAAAGYVFGFGLGAAAGDGRLGASGLGRLRGSAGTPPGRSSTGSPARSASSGSRS